MFQDIDLGHTYRTVSRPLTPEMNEIYRIRPEIINKEGEGICFRSPKNFIGALLLQLDQAANMADLMRTGSQSLDSILTPFQIFDQVPLTYSDSQKGFLPLGLTAQQVLFKKICGLKVGLVMTGPVAGLILRTQIGVKPEDSLCVNRIWNDTAATVTNRPYNPYLDRSDRDISLTEVARRVSRMLQGNSLSIDQFQNNVKKRYSDRYDAELSAVQQAATNPGYFSDIFFRLCRQLDLKIDMDNFHFTRIKNGMEDNEKQKSYP